MRSNNFRSIAIVLIVTIAVFLQGCTLLGAHLGGQIDKKKGHMHSVNPIKIMEQKQWTRVAGTTIHDSTFDCSFSSIKDMSPSEYSGYFKKYYIKSEMSDSIPEPGDSVTITFAKHNVPARFSGFAYDLNFKPDYKTTNSTLTVVRWTSGEKSSGDEHHITDLKSIAFSNGEKLKGGEIRKLSKNNRLPLMTSAEIVDRDGNTQLLPLSDIKELKVPGGGHRALIGGLIGLACDITVFYIYAMASLSDSWKIGVRM